MKTLQIIDHITLWLKNYAKASGMAGFVVGVSGGIDSAVTSTLCARTGLKVLVLNMPIHQASDQVSRSSAHIKWLENTYDNVTGQDMDLTPAFDQIKASFPDPIQDGLTMANTRSRLRMLTLYAFASHHKRLVAGTGNRVEDFGVGFYTKYGDGGVDLSPIADLMKSEVYALGKELGVSRDILNARPTDGLWDDDRTDENQIGATYAELEWAMAHLDLKGRDKEGADESLTPRQKEVLEIFNGFHAANRHKMDPIPVCMIPEGLKR
ncbi:NAD(+) synthase [Desulfospira joergensenii]|uniref:NAD(+) synthase n=1 Tax=Desulfospira joergensenii TaxID=53329 RepID=UPI0003B554B4|nr:NAD(+) synthase [Desulfospira joergensenii]